MAYNNIFFKKVLINNNANMAKLTLQATKNTDHNYRKALKKFYQH